MTQAGAGEALQTRGDHRHRVRGKPRRCVGCGNADAVQTRPPPLVVTVILSLSDSADLLRASPGLVRLSDVS